MASEKQTSANRSNAAKSTGPRTQNGKLQSRRNAVRHGLTAATVVTAIEDAEDFEWFAAAIKSDYQPCSAVEHELVARLASLLWRLRRAALIETNLFELQGRLAAEQKLVTRAGPDTPSPRLDIFYRLLLSPVPSQADSNPAGLTHHETDAPHARENVSRYPNPATVFLRLCNLTSFPIERINRYEIAMWRQVAQTLFLLDGCRKRSSPPSPAGNLENQ